MLRPWQQCRPLHEEISVEAARDDERRGVARPRGGRS